MTSLSLCVTHINHHIFLCVEFEVMWYHVSCIWLFVCAYSPISCHRSDVFINNFQILQGYHILERVLDVLEILNWKVLKLYWKLRDVHENSVNFETDPWNPWIFLINRDLLDTFIESAQSWSMSENVLVACGNIILPIYCHGLPSELILS